jgi:hypothetical protein
MNETLQKLLPQLIELMAPLLMAVIGLLAFELRKLIQAHIKNSYLQLSLTRLDDAVEHVVLELSQTLVTELKSAAADGKIDPLEAAKLKRIAKDNITSYLGTQGVSDLEQVFGVAALTAMIEAKIESTVLKNKVVAIEPVFPQEASTKPELKALKE